MEIDKEKNRLILEQVIFCLLDAVRLYNQLNPSGLNSSQQKEWKWCKNALEYTKESVEKLHTLFG